MLDEDKKKDQNQSENDQKGGEASYGDSDLRDTETDTGDMGETGSKDNS